MDSRILVYKVPMVVQLDLVSGYYSCAPGTASNVVVGQLGGQTATTGGGGNQFSGNPRGGGL